MVFNATFNNISVILKWSVLFVEKTGVLQVTDKLLSHNVVSSSPHHEQDSNSQLYLKGDLFLHFKVYQESWRVVQEEEKHQLGHHTGWHQRSVSSTNSFSF